MATGYRRIAGMATMPSRERTAPQALASLAGQFERLYLVLNAYNSVPQWAQQAGVEVILPADDKDYGAAGKLLGLSLEQHIDDVIYYCVDDDMLYPDDFASRLERKLAGHERAIIGVHGSVIRHPFSSWREDRVVHSLRRPNLKDRQVDVVATCACAFRASAIEMDAAGWPEAYRNCVDLQLANIAAEQGVERWIVRHSGRWLRQSERRQDDSIYRRMLGDDSLHSELARQLGQAAEP